MIFYCLGYNMPKYDKYISNIPDNENDQAGKVDLENEQEELELTSESDSSGTTIRDIMVHYWRKIIIALMLIDYWMIVKYQLLMESYGRMNGGYGY